MKRQGYLAAGLLGSATALCLLFSRHGGLGASEDGSNSFREALTTTNQPPPVEQEDGIRLNYYDATWAKVLKDLAESEGLTLVMDTVPPGRFARRDKKRYDLNSAVRLLNSELEPQGFRLLVQKSFLIVLSLDKARTEYARPRLSQLEDPPEERSGATSSIIRPASATRISATSDDEVASPLLARNRVSSAGTLEEENVPTLPEFSSPIHPVSHSGKVVPDEETPVTPAGPMIIEEVDLENGKASEIARTIYVVFQKRAELQKSSINGFPGFTVYDRADDGTGNGDLPLFRIGIDQQANQILIEATASQAKRLRRLVGELDKPTEFGDAGAVKVVENKGISAKTAQQLNDQIHQLVSLADETPGGRSLPVQRPAAGDQKTPEDGPAINLRGEVNVQAMQDLGILILKGNEADVAKVEEIIQRLETMSVGSLPSIHVLTLQNIDSEAMATLLTSVYTELTTLRQRGGENRKTAAFIPVVQPNAILILSSEIEREAILQLADELDKPLNPESEFKVFPLKSAIASQVVTALDTFYAERPGLGTTVRAIADVRTNSVVVQGSASELAEVSTLIERIDRDDPASTVRMQMFKLKQAVAEELSTTINAALQAVINPPQQTTGQGGGGFGAGAGQGAQALRDNKSVALEFLSSSGGVSELIRSGILADVRVSADVRSNTLIVTAPEASMTLMAALVEALDRAPDAVSEIKVFTLKNADAQQSVTLLESLFENTNQEDQLGIQLAGTEGTSSSLIPLRFSADIRTNTVLAVGSAESLSVVEAILLRLDNDDTRQRMTTVIPLRNAPAELVAATLLDFLEQQQALQTSSEDLISNIERIRQEVLVSADTNSNSLIVSASPQYFSQVTQIIQTLDAQPPEVVIQALLVEVTLDATDEFGIELGFQDPLLMTRSLATATATSGTPGLNFNNTSVGLGNNVIAGSNPGNVATQGLSNFSLGRQNGDLGFGGFVFSAQSDAVSVLLRALAARRTVHVLSRPQVRTTHNNEALVNVGQNVPLVSGITTNLNGGASPQVDRQQTGIILRVTPRITPDGIVAMDVYAEKSKLDAGGGLPIFVNPDGSTINSPIINQSIADTTVNVPNGQTIVIGGMITKSDNSLERKVPWLGDLPIVGRAFRYDSTRSERTELLIFLTPRIVLSDLDSELIKQVEAERLHFIESDAEELHGPLYSVPQSQSESQFGSPEYYEQKPETPEMTPIGDSVINPVR